MIVHEAQCDRCGHREPADERAFGAESIGAAVYGVPEGWIRFDDKIFCDLGCLGTWATETFWKTGWVEPVTDDDDEVDEPLPIESVG